MRQDHLLDKIQSSALFGYAKCVMKFPDNLREKLANLPSIFKTTNVLRQGFGPLLHEYSVKEGSKSQPRRTPISSFQLAHGKITTPLVLFCSEFGLVCLKFYSFVENTTVKCFNDFVQELSMLVIEDKRVPMLLLL